MPYTEIKQPIALETAEPTGYHKKQQAATECRYLRLFEVQLLFFILSVA
ncbi:MAG: hypothetical protein ACLTSK_05260 [Christensenellales bacterium]